MKRKSAHEAAAMAIVILIILSIINGLCTAGIYLISMVIFENPVEFIDGLRIMWGITLIAGGYSIARELF